MRQLEAKRARHAPGFYKALHERSTADLLESAISKVGTQALAVSAINRRRRLVARRLFPLGQDSQQEKEAGKTFDKPAICMTSKVSMML